MKIQTLLFENIYSPENLYHAWHKVSLGKSAKSSVLNFYRNLDKNLSSIAEDLKNGTYQPGHYNLFLIRDPKERIISASPVRDRVVQHAIMNYYDPVFDRNLIFDSYACRVGKGIAGNAFANNPNLKSITIPEGLIIIGSGAFNNCTSLINVNIPNSVTEIGYCAFGSCTQLISVTFQGIIPSSGFDNTSVGPFYGDLRAKFYATDTTNGTPGVYTRPNNSDIWTEQLPP